MHRKNVNKRNKSFILLVHIMWARIKPRFAVKLITIVYYPVKTYSLYHLKYYQLLILFLKVPLKLTKHRSKIEYFKYLHCQFDLFSSLELIDLLEIIRGG